MVGVWDCETLMCLRTLGRLDFPIRTLSISHDGRFEREGEGEGEGGREGGREREEEERRKKQKRNREKQNHGAVNVNSFFFILIFFFFFRFVTYGSEDLFLDISDIETGHYYY